MNNVVQIGKVPWSRRDMLSKLEEFASLYENRPIKDNTGGMKSPHMFSIWFALKALKPKAIIESGVWLGQGTWFFENACPEAQLYCIDLNIDRIQYRSGLAKYFDLDFSTIDWNGLPKSDTLLFFDDHQNAYERMKTAKWFGFKHVIFEDNYPPSQGDFYSIKKILMHSGFKYIPAHKPSFKSKVKNKIKTLIGFQGQQYERIIPNDIDAKYLMQNLEVYYEFPPVFRVEQTRWGDIWDNDNYPTSEPLLTTVDRKYQQIFLDEAKFYTWMCYLKLK
jgi:hypothetical protein